MLCSLCYHKGYQNKSTKELGFRVSTAVVILFRKATVNCPDHVATLAVLHPRASACDAFLAITVLGSHIVPALRQAPPRDF